MNIKTRKIKVKNKVGHPPLYKTAEELDAKIQMYFNGGAYKRKVITGLGVTVEIPCPTISDLVLFLGFCDRQQFYSYEKKPQFSYTIKKARTLITREYENLLRNQSCTGAIFALKNLGWSDTPVVDMSVKNYVQIYRPEPYTREEVDTASRATDRGV